MGLESKEDKINRPGGNIQLGIDYKCACNADDHGEDDGFEEGIWDTTVFRRHPRRDWEVDMDAISINTDDMRYMWVPFDSFAQGQV